MDEVENAQAAFREAAVLCPDLPIWHWRHLGLCPAVFTTETEIHQYRSNLEAKLDEALAEAPAFDWRYALRDGIRPSFNLSFHGCCNRQIKEKFAKLYCAAFPSECPSSPRKCRIRVGFICTGGHERGFVRGFGGIMARLDPARFEAVGIVTRDVVRFCQQNVPATDLSWVGIPRHLERAGRIVQDLQCDVVIHWHAGSDALNYFLPYLPLAPVQCIAFGASGTTGIPNIDYFVSSDLFERGKQAEQDYSEQLVTFDGLTTWQNRLPETQPAERSDFGLPASGALYFCPQQVGKFHPQFDRLLRQILERDPTGHIVALKARRQHSQEALQTRLANAIGTALAKRMVFLQMRKPTDYYRLLALADVVLDAPAFSTSLTGFDALAAGKPIVTIPGQYMAQRYAYGLYAHLGLRTLIVENEREYVNLAVELGGNEDFRFELGREIRTRSSRLFESTQAVRSYESFLERVSHPQ